MKYITQVIEANFPWHKVKYGGPFDQLLANSQDEVYEKINADKIDLRFTTDFTELSESVFGVYKGNNIVIEWRNGLEQFLPKYSTPSGKPLIYISSTPYLGVYSLYSM